MLYTFLPFVLLAIVVFSLPLNWRAVRAAGRAGHAPGRSGTFVRRGLCGHAPAAAPALPGDNHLLHNPLLTVVGAAAYPQLFLSRAKVIQPGAPRRPRTPDCTVS